MVDCERSRAGDCHRPVRSNSPTCRGENLRAIQHRHDTQRGSQAGAPDTTGNGPAIRGTLQPGTRGDWFREIAGDRHVSFRAVGAERVAMKIDKIVLRQVRMPLVNFFETSFGRTYERQIILV